MCGRRHVRADESRTGRPARPVRSVSERSEGDEDDMANAAVATPRLVLARTPPEREFVAVADRVERGIGSTRDQAEIQELVRQAQRLALRLQRHGPRRLRRFMRGAHLHLFGAASRSKNGVRPRCQRRAGSRRARPSARARAAGDDPGRGRPPSGRALPSSLAGAHA
jgi:hypothetical protein